MGSSAPIIWVAGGGTGGHAAAAVAVAAAVLERGARPLLVADGAAVPALRRWAPTVPLLPLPALQGPWRGPRLLQALAALATQPRPHGVIGLGAAASVPAVLAGRARGARVVIHEQNAVPGRANRLLAPLAHVRGAAFAEVWPQVVPVPVRAAFQSRPPPRGRRVLVLGGSAGAPCLDAAVIRALSRWRRAGITGLWHTRLTDAGPLTPQRWIHDVPVAIASADVVITVAGALSLAEAGRVGRPCVVLPRRDVAGDHQQANAVALEARGAVLLPTTDQLGATVEHLLTDLDRADQLAANLSAWAAPGGAAALAEAALR
jgi:UDP-N-acetylglucosamine--N-acetylmuramyl-(pentapeptide) pyrophosphoryl-undecaprenol N-acetylglucosamine transferase